MPVTKPPCTIIPFECVRSTEGEKSHTNESSSISFAPLNPRISKNGGISFRKNYAGLGFTYDPIRDAFISPKPYPSWILNEETCIWEAPVPHPNDNQLYSWDETTKSWLLSTN